MVFPYLLGKIIHAYFIALKKLSAKAISYLIGHLTYDTLTNIRGKTSSLQNTNGASA